MKKSYLKFAIKIARNAGDILLRHQNQNFGISYKNRDKKNVVTEIDYKSEQFIIKTLQKEYPEHTILGEESGFICSDNSPYRWIIDPIDGTTNYTHGYGFYAVSIALEIHGEIQAGIVYAPYFNELFYASKGKGAFFNGRKIQSSNVKKLELSLLGSIFSYKRYQTISKQVGILFKKTQGIRRTGATALDLCHIAAGRLDGYFAYGCKIWDIAAGKLILEEAGGEISNIDGTPLDMNAENILATNGHIHKKIQKIFQT